MLLVFLLRTALLKDVHHVLVRGPVHLAADAVSSGQPVSATSVSTATQMARPRIRLSSGGGKKVRVR
jgi:hypothetical protein